MKVLVLYYSMTGNIFEMAKAVAKGAAEVPGAEVDIKTVPELVPESKWNDAIRRAKALQKDVPVCTVDELSGYDAIVLGTPTRFGNMAAQMKNFIDQTGGLWFHGKLIGKPFGVFTGSATQHGGQETTIISSAIPLLHHGMIYVGVPFSVHELMEVSEVHGGSPYGASVIVGPDASGAPKTQDLAVARHLGRRVAEIAGKLAS